MDEIWTYIMKKNKNIESGDDKSWGDFWIFTAVNTHSEPPQIRPIISKAYNVNIYKKLTYKSSDTILTRQNDTAQVFC
jgi:hypothetical protein